jgi:thymidylate synthase (FAD)
MNIVTPGFEILTPIDSDTILKHLEACGRTCYKSEDRATPDSCYGFVKAIIRRGHEAVLEHFSITVRFICDRGVSHEIVRHRLASYCQESTRYCNYGNEQFNSEITVIEPLYLEQYTDAYSAWQEACEIAEIAYFKLLDWGCTPQEARAVLPNSLKTEVVMTANLREWRHFFKLRCASAAHPQMREIATPLLRTLQKKLPVVFDDIEVTV